MRKFVTYINLYDQQDQRVRNVGFGKFLIDGGRCQMEIHMKNTGLLDQSSSLYLFKRSGEILLGIEAGVVSIHNGTVDFRKIVDVAELTSRQIDTQQVDGFLLFSKEQQMIASQWTDGMIRRNQFELWKPEQEKNQEKNQETNQEKNPELPQEAGAVQEQEPAEVQRQEDEPGEAQRQEDEPGEAQRQEDESGEAQRQEDEPGEAQERVQEAGPAQEQEPGKAKKQEEPVQTSTSEGNVHSTELPMQNMAQILQVVENLRNMTNARESDKASAQKSSEQAAKQQSANEQAANQQPANQQAAHQPAWQQLWENYNVQRPFAGRDDISCVQIQLKDIKHLPKDYWYLGNNNFLLHGFCNYRYLLFGKMQEEEIKYFLGIPGIYQNQEHVMASIFGFPEFLPERPGGYNTGKFGVWYRFIRL